MEEGADQNEATEDDPQSSPLSCNEYVSEYNPDSSDCSIDTTEPALPSESENIDEFGDISSNIEYLDETEEEFRLTESIQRLKQKTDSQTSKAQAEKPIGEYSNFIKNKNESIIEKWMNQMITKSSITTIICASFFDARTLRHFYAAAYGTYALSAALNTQIREISRSMH